MLSVINWKYVIAGSVISLLLVFAILILIYLYTLYYVYRYDSEDLSTWREDRLIDIKTNEINQLQQLSQLVGTSMAEKTSKSKKK